LSEACLIGMNSQYRDPVHDMLSDEEIELLGQWQKAWSYAEIAQYLGVRYETVSRWHHRTHGVTRRLYPIVAAVLRQKPWLSAPDPCAALALALPTHRSTSLDAPDDRLRSVYEAGRRFHYERFQPDAAMYMLAPMASDPAFALLPPHEALNMLAVTMAILRQSVHAGEGDFLIRGHLCLKLVAGISGRALDKKLAAAIATVAWELIAVTAQRGWAREAVPGLETVEEILKRRGLHEALEPGRTSSMARLMHWARVVAYPDLGAVRSYVKRGGSIADAQGQSDARPVEAHHLVLHHISEQMRFSLQQGADKKQTERIFDERLCPIIRNLYQSSQHFFAPVHLERAIPANFTPSTAMGIVFQYLAVALHLGRSGVNHDIEQAVELRRRIQAVSDDAIMLLQFNDETQKFVRLARANRKISPEVLESFHFVSHVSPAGRRKLHAMASQLLDMVRGERVRA
jgi:hypothetical protein